MFLRDDMINFVWDEGDAFRNQAIFTHSAEI